MIRHIVFFMLPEGCSASAEELAARLRSMDGRIPGLLQLEAGVDFSRQERSFDVALMTTFANREDLAAYAVDPLHQEVIAWIKSHGILTKVVDYESAII